MLCLYYIIAHVLTLDWWLAQKLPVQVKYSYVDLFNVNNVLY